AAEDADTGTQAFGAQAGTAEQPAATDGSEDGVKAGDFFEQFFGGGGLAGDDAVIVVGMNQDSAGFRLNARGSFLARGDGWLAESDFAPVGFDGAAFYGWRVFGHDDPCGNASPRGGAGHRGAVVAARRRDDAARSFLFGQREDGVAGPANFERACFLQVFTLEKEPGAGDGVEGVGGEDGSAVD